MRQLSPKRGSTTPFWGGVITSPDLVTRSFARPPVYAPQRPVMVPLRDAASEYSTLATGTLCTTTYEPSGQLISTVDASTVSLPPCGRLIAPSLNSGWPLTTSVGRAGKFGSGGYTPTRSPATL